MSVFDANSLVAGSSSHRLPILISVFAFLSLALNQKQELANSSKSALKQSKNNIQPSSSAFSKPTPLTTDDNPSPSPPDSCTLNDPQGKSKKCFPQQMAIKRTNQQHQYLLQIKSIMHIGSRVFYTKWHSIFILYKSISQIINEIIESSILIWNTLTKE